MPSHPPAVRRAAACVVGLAFGASAVLLAIAPASAASTGVIGPTTSTPTTSTPTSTSTSSSLPPALPGELVYLSDSDFYATPNPTTLATVAPNGSDRQVLVANTTASIGLASLSPDGTQLAYYRGTSSSAAIDTMTLSTRAVTAVLRLRGSGAFVDGMAWTPLGTSLIVASNEAPGSSTTHKTTALWRVPLGGGTSQRLTGYEDAGSVSVAPDGTIVYVVSKTFSSETLQSSALWMCAADGSDPHRLLTSSRFIDEPSVSPDGQTVIFSLVKSETTSHLESIAIGGSRVTSLTPAVKGRADVEPSWTPDGSYIVFLSSRAGRYVGSKADQLLDAYLMTASGADVTKEIAYEGDKTSVGLVSWGP